MSKIRTSAAALSVIALGAGAAATYAPASAEASVCGARPTVGCSVYYAKQTDTSAKPGTSGWKVASLQKSLRNVGFNVAVTGTFNAATKTAVSNYQYTRKIARTGWLDAKTLAFLRAGAGVYRALPTSTSVTSTASKAVAFAYSQLGKPYRYGATGPSSYDCSGLMLAAYRAGGKSIPRTSGAQLGAYTKVSKSALRPGDIVGFYGGGHVGIYVGNGIVIHAPHTGDVVRKASLSSMPYYFAVRPTH